MCMRCDQPDLTTEEYDDHIRADYQAAPGGGPLTGREVATPWDPELA